ncbi:MAG: hypothetical protein FIA92_09135 [Chloroflexi bacterium]|nr:hypothetical protein [Chloroflexota bacterium]
MSRSRVLVLLVAIVVAACGPGPSAQPGETPDVSSPVAGVIVAVDSAGLSDVRSFTLRTDSGFAFEFQVGPLENATEFPLGHLGEHLASSEPVRVWFREEGGARVVYRIEDAAD